MSERSNIPATRGPHSPQRKAPSGAEQETFAFHSESLTSDKALIEMLASDPKAWPSISNLDAVRKNSALLAYVERSGLTLTKDQKEALFFTEALLTSQNPDAPKCLIIDGRAGTGKTTILTGIAKWSTSNGNPILLMTHTNSARVNAEKRAGNFFNQKNSSTLYSLLYGSLNNKKHKYGNPRPLPPGLRLLIVDETSLVNSSMLKDLAVLLRNRPEVKLILLGDKLQLEGIEDESFSDGKKRFDLVPLRRAHIRLKEVLRQKEGPVLNLATRIGDWLESQDTSREAGSPVPNLKTDEIIPWSEIPKASLSTLTPGLYRYSKGDLSAKELYAKLWTQSPGDTVLIAAKNDDRVLFNNIIRKTIQGNTEEKLLPGEPLIVLTNAGGKYVNGTFLVTPETIKEATPLEIDLKGEKIFIYEIPDPLAEKTKDPLDQDLFSSQLGPKIRIALFPNSKEPSINDLDKKAEKLRKEAARLKDRGQAQKLKEQAAALENSVPVTYAYAITGHKAQGMEWKNVIVAANDVEKTVSGQVDGVAHWFYSALTRATESAFIWQPG